MYNLYQWYGIYGFFFSSEHFIDQSYYQIIPMSVSLNCFTEHLNKEHGLKSWTNSWIYLFQNDESSNTVHAASATDNDDENHFLTSLAAIDQSKRARMQRKTMNSHNIKDLWTVVCTARDMIGVFFSGSKVRFSYLL